jgi:hypothetical protein
MTTIRNVRVSLMIALASSLVACGGAEPTEAMLDETGKADSASQSVLTASGVTWKLVASKQDPHSGRVYQVWKDTSTGVLWGDRLDSGYRYGKASCGSEEGQRSVAGLNTTGFRIPLSGDLQQAYEDGANEVLSDMGDGQHSYWASDPIIVLPNLCDYTGCHDLPVVQRERVRVFEGASPARVVLWTNPNYPYLNSVRCIRD